MDQIKRFAFVFLHDEFEPIHERIVHAFMRAETRDKNFAGAENLFVGGWQAEVCPERRRRARSKDADIMSNSCKRFPQSSCGDCETADVWCILFAQ